MFYIKDGNSGEKPGVEDKKIADYITILMDMTQISCLV